MSTAAATESSLRTRLLRGAGATALGPVVTAAIQLGTVPVLLHAWGPAKYGDWLLMSAIPSYLTLSNLGFGDASGSDMTARTAAGDRDGALKTFHSSLALLLGVSLFVLLVSAAVIPHVPWTRLLHLSGYPDGSAEIVLLVLTAYVVVSQQNGILESGFRCDGNYALGAFLGNVIRFSETVLASLAGIWTGSFIYVAVTYLLVRACGVLCAALLLKKKSPWLTIGIRCANWHTIRKLAAPAFGFVVLPLGYAISLQGFTLVVGNLLGPIAVVAFSTLRTMTRMTSQFLNVIGFTVWPELSAAFGAGKLELARSLHRRSYQLGLALSLVSACTLWVVGPLAYGLWIHHSVVFDSPTFHILLGVTLAYSLWFISGVVPMSTNAHSRISITFVSISGVSLLLARFLLIPLLGLPGAAWSLLLIDLCMAWVVLNTSLRLLGDTFPEFALALLSRPGVSRQGDRITADLSEREAEPMHANRVNDSLSILYLGVENGTCLHRAKALERLGHRVEIVNPRKFLPKNRLVDYLIFHKGGKAFEGWVRARLLKQLPHDSYDVAWVDSGTLIGPRLVMELKKRCEAVINYNHDDPFGTRDGLRFQLYRAAVPFYDLITVVRECNVAEANALGAQKVVLVSMTADEVAHSPIDISDEDRARWSSDVLFVGTWMPERGPFLARLVELGVPLTIYGDNWQKAGEWPLLQSYWKGSGIYSDEQYAKAILCAKICLGLLSKGNRDESTTRSFEIPLLGGVLCAERTPEHERFYCEDQEAVFWSTPDECAAQCKRLLEDTQLRFRISKQGRERCIQNQTTHEPTLNRILLNALPIAGLREEAA